MKPLKNFLILIISTTTLFSSAQTQKDNIKRSVTKQEYSNLLECISETKITTFRQGDIHRFIDVWMVIVDDRIFARSWRGSKTGWYYKFLKDSNGAIQCGDVYYKIDGLIPSDLDNINQRINDAFTKKYGKGDYPEIAKEMIQPDRMVRTIEFIINIKE